MIRDTQTVFTVESYISYYIFFLGPEYVAPQSSAFQVLHRKQHVAPV